MFLLKICWRHWKSEFFCQQTSLSNQLALPLVGSNEDIHRLIREVIILSSQVKLFSNKKIIIILYKYRENLIKVQIEKEHIYSSCYPEHQGGCRFKSRVI